LSSFIENGKTKMDGKSNAQTEDNLKKLCRFVYFPFRELMTQCQGGNSGQEHRGNGEWKTNKGRF
jgi:hypothetical protein